MDLIAYIPAWAVVVCVSCQVGITMDRHFDTHFKRQHALGRSTRQMMRAHIAQQYPRAIHQQEDIEEYFRQREPGSVIDELGSPHRGLGCAERDTRGEPCRYVCSEAHGMKRHYREVHGWVNPQRRGGSRLQRARVTRPWRTEVPCQQMFAHGPFRGYREVQPDEPGQSDPARSESINTPADRLWQHIQTKTEELDQQQAAVTTGTKLDANRWLDRTQWATHLAGFRWEQLIEWAALPEESGDPVLWEMCQSFDRMISIAQEAIVDRHCPFFSRFHINKKQKGEVCRTPFQARMESDTRQRYCQVFHRIMGYMYRTRDTKEAERPGYRMTSNQQGRWDEFVNAARVAATTRHEEENVPRPGGAVEVDDEEPVDDDEMDDDPDVVPRRPPKVLTPMRPIDRSGLEMWIELFKPRLENDHFHSVVLSALAAIAVDHEQHTWIIAENYTPQLSAVVKLARMMVVLYGVDRGEEGCVSRIESMINRFMVEDQPCAMHWIYSTRRYGLKIRYTTTAGGHIRWEKSTVSYQDARFNMDQFRGWIRGMVDECRRTLVEDVLLLPPEKLGESDTIPAIPWTDMGDNPSESRPGFHFMEHNARYMPVAGDQWMFDRVVRTASGRSEFVTANGAWRGSRVQQHMRAIRRFKEKLLMCMHTTGGQPSRAPELLSVRYCNTHTGGRRNVFIEDGQVVFVTAYHKGYSFDGSTKIIHRYLPREVGELLVWYLWLARPFEEQLLVGHHGVRTSHGYMWRTGAEDPQWTSERVRQLIRRESVIGMGVRLNISSYRQLAIAITRKYLKGEGFNDDREDENIEDQGETERDGVNIPRQRDSVFDQQTGHGSAVAGMIYARAILEAPGAVSSMRAQFRAASGGWHRFLEFPSTMERGVKRERGAVDMDDGYAQQLARWRRVKGENVQDALKALVGPDARFRGVQEESLAAIMSGAGPVVTVMGTGGGKSMLFMLPAMCSAAVARRDGGLTGVTVVVIPMVSLREDLQRRCEKHDIACVEWERRRPPKTVSIVLVTPESAIKKGFQDYLIELGASGRLERIVIDECHVVLDATGEFRPQLRELSRLLVAETQMVLLTATLPPSEQDELLGIFQLPEQQVHVFRAPTTRRNVRYQVVPRRIPSAGCEESSDVVADAQVVEIVQAKLQQYPQGKVVVYGRSIERVKRVAAQVGCESYFRSVAEKSAVFQRIVGATCRVVVATNALGLGIDIPDIRVVVHMDAVSKLRDFGQESGRAGRDGATSESIVIAGPIAHEGGRRTQRQTTAAVERPLAPFETGRVCARVILDGYLDGRTNRDACEEGEEACWVCEAATRTEAVVAQQAVTAAAQHEEAEFARITAQRRRVREQMQWMTSNTAMEVDEFRRRIEEWAGRCPYCLLQGRDEASVGHGLGSCPFGGATCQAEFNDTRQHIKYGRYGVCYQCGIPQAICRRFEANGFGRWRYVRGQTCQYPDVMIGAVVAIMLHGPEEVAASVEEWMAQDGIEMTDADGVHQWLGQKIMWGEMEAAMINKVFLRLVQIIG